MKVFHVDAFTKKPFKGNPACVCVTDGALDEKFMQDFAFEMNLSETAFVHKLENGNLFSLRWFTPTMEVDLCGHATLASAHVLYDLGIVDRSDECVFESASGILKAKIKNEMIELDFPIGKIDYESVSMDFLRDMAAALCVEIIGGARSETDLIIELAHPKDVVNLKPDMDYICDLPVRGVVVTAKGTEGVPEADDADFTSRYFAPCVGVPEDPVTGIAHCALGPYWGKKLNKTEMLGYQASRRTGFVRVRLEGERIALGGAAVTVLTGNRKPGF